MKIMNRRPTSAGVRFLAAGSGRMELTSPRRQGPVDAGTALSRHFMRRPAAVPPGAPAAAVDEAPARLGLGRPPLRTPAAGRALRGGPGALFSGAGGGTHVRPTHHRFAGGALSGCGA